jgi:broad specificity phosphatase PhoE
VTFADVQDETYTPRDINVIICTHGLTMRLMLMKWFKYTVEDFEQSLNPPNAAFALLVR